MELRYTNEENNSHSLRYDISNPYILSYLETSSWLIDKGIDGTNGEEISSSDRVLSPFYNYTKGFDMVDVIADNSMEFNIAFYDKNKLFISDTYISNNTWSPCNTYRSIDNSVEDAEFYRIILSNKNVLSSEVAIRFKNRYTKLNITYDNWIAQQISDETGQPDHTSQSYRLHSDYIKIPYNKTKVSLLSRMTKNENSTFFIYEYDENKNYLKSNNISLMSSGTFMNLQSNTKFIRPYTTWDSSITEHHAHRYVLLFDD